MIAQSQGGSGVGTRRLARARGSKRRNGAAQIAFSAAALRRDSWFGGAPALRVSPVLRCLSDKTDADLTRQLQHFLRRDWNERAAQGQRRQLLLVVRRSRAELNLAPAATAVQFDASINPGNSG